MKGKKKEPEVIHISYEVREDDGVIVSYTAVGEAIALRLPRSGRVVDLRVKAPFLVMVPCPYCGVLNDKGHDPLRHVDPFLGEWI